VTNGRISELKGCRLYGEGMRLFAELPRHAGAYLSFLKKPASGGSNDPAPAPTEYFKHPAESARRNNLSRLNVAPPPKEEKTWHDPLGVRHEVAWAPPPPRTRQRMSAETAVIRTANQMPRGPVDHTHNFSDVPIAHPNSIKKETKNHQW